MIPARTSCPSSWTREYYGYLMANAEEYVRTMFECIDVNSQSATGVGQDSDGALFYFTESTCNDISCPPYADGREIACVVCTK